MVYYGSFSFLLVDWLWCLEGLRLQRDGFGAEGFGVPACGFVNSGASEFGSLLLGCLGRHVSFLFRGSLTSNTKR